MASTKGPETDLNKLSKAELIELIKKNNNDKTIRSRIRNVKSDVANNQTAKQQNSPGLGIEYEVYLPAYFALLLNINPEIKDFQLKSNVQGFGNLDDLLVDIATKSGENLFFAFQLKHKEKSSKNLLPSNFEARGDFNLEKYCEAFKNLNEENRKRYHFILYTNKNFDSSRTNDEVKKFDMKQDECCLGSNFFDTSGDGKHLYQFEVNEETEDGKSVNKDDFQKFFSQFSLYTGQATIKDLEKSILDILKHKECYATYIDFFRRWHRGDFIDKILDMKTLNVHLLDILLSSVAINYHLSDGEDGNSIFFETMVQQFDITIIDASKQDFITLLEENVLKYPDKFSNSSEEIIKLGKKNKFIDRFAKELKEGAKVKLLHYFYPKFIKQLTKNVLEYPEDFNKSLEECNKDSEEYKILVEERKFIEELKKGTELKLLQDFYKKFMRTLKENFQAYLEEFDKNSEEYMLQFAKDDNKFIEELKEETKLKLLHYFYQKPLILDFNESSKDLIYEASKLCKIQETGIKLIILGRDIDITNFSHLKIFTSLTLVDGDFAEEIKRRCNLSLQGRNISFEEIFEDEIREFVTPKEIFQMLKGNFSVGEEKEILPEHYIPRTVSATIFDIESIIKNSSSGSTAIIFYCKDKFENLKTTIQTIVGHEDVPYENFNKTTIILKRREESFKDQLIPTIILTNEECSKQQFDTIQEKVLQLKKEEQPLLSKMIAMILSTVESSKQQFDKMWEKTKKKILRMKKETDSKEDGDDDTIKNEVHLFKLVTEKKCLLLMSTKSISSIENYKSTKISVDENDIHAFFNNSINILCAQPGMGKSALMKCLKNKCGSSFWTIRVDLKAHNDFFKRNQKIEDVLNHFLELEKCLDIFHLKTKEVFLRKQKMVFFLDGLDEVENECVDCVLNITKQLSEIGCRIWLSSRQSLQQKIENYFNSFAIEIDEINENQQKKYIEERLTSQYNENQIKEIVKKIFNNTDLASNRQILEIPLQLHIITEAFINDQSHYSNLSESNFILTKMFEIFFNGKYKHYINKFESKHTHLLGGLEEQLEKYEIMALHSMLDDEHFQKLQIDKLNPTLIKSSDCLSIIKGVNNQNKAEFEHLTYAEYFASKFLVKNFEKVRILTEQIFSKKYQNLFFIFNIMLAESSPLHLAIIYKNVEQIHQTEGPFSVDKGGRNLLQLASCFATRHPSLKCEVRYEGVFFKTKFVIVKDFLVKHFKGEDSKIKEIVDSAVLLSAPFKNDEIFKWNSLDYALAAGALYVVEAILLKFGKPLNFYQALGKYYSDEVIAYYSIRFGYHRLLSEILAKKTCDVWSIHIDNLKNVNQLDQLIFRLTDNNNFWLDLNRFLGLFAVATIVFPYLGVFALLSFILVLAETNTTKSILRFSMLPVCANRRKIIELLIGDGINKTVFKDNNFSLLHLAVIYEDTEVVNFLLERGADVNIKDNYRRSPLFLATSNNIEQDQTQLILEIEENVTNNTNQNLTQLSTTINSCYGWNIEVIKLLLNKGANIKETDKMLGEPLIQLAAKKGIFDLVSILIDKGASWNEETFLHAIYGGNTQIIDLFLRKGVDMSKLTALYKKKYTIRS